MTAELLPNPPQSNDHEAAKPLALVETPNGTDPFDALPDFATSRREFFATPESEAPSKPEPETQHAEVVTEDSGDAFDALPDYSTHRQAYFAKLDGTGAAQGTTKLGGKLELADLVQLDKAGRAHVSGSHNVEGSDKRARNGTFISKHQLEQIELHEEQIRKGLSERAVENNVGRVDASGRAHRDNGQMMSNKELASLLKDTGDAYTPEQTSKDKRQSDRELDQLLGGLAAAEATPATNIDTNGQATPDNAGTSAANVDPNTTIENTANQTTQPVHRTLKDRMLRRLSLASVYLKEGMQKLGDYLSDEEKGKRRGIVAGSVLGVAAVGAVFGPTLAAKYGIDMPHLPSHSGGGASGGSPDALNNLTSAPEHMALHQGDTIWGDLSQLASQNGHHLSDAQINELTNQTLQANGLSWEDARHMAVGTNFMIPDEVREQLARAA